MYGFTATEKGRKILKRFHAVIRKIHREKILKNTGSCCGSCASYEAQTDLQEKDEYADYLGYMTFNVQSKDSAREDGQIWVGHGAKRLESPWKKASAQAEEYQEAAYEQACRLVGFTLKLFFEREGFEVDWNGNSNRKLKLTLKED